MSPIWTTERSRHRETLLGRTGVAMTVVLVAMAAPGVAQPELCNTGVMCAAGMCSATITFQMTNYEHSAGLSTMFPPATGIRSNAACGVGSTMGVPTDPNGYTRQQNLGLMGTLMLFATQLNPSAACRFVIKTQGLYNVTSSCRSPPPTACRWS